MNNGLAKRLQIILFSSPFEIAERCMELESLCDDILQGRANLQEFFKNLPEILQQIFGVSGSSEPSWFDLATDYVDKEKLVTILGPDSPLFRLLATFHSKKNLVYEFPLQNIPATTRRLFLEGKFAQIPAVYAGRYEPSPQTRVLYLSMYDFFLYNFVMFPLRDKSRVKVPDMSSDDKEKKRKKLQRKEDSKNPNLDRMDVYHFLLNYYLEILLAIRPMSTLTGGNVGFVDFSENEFQKNLPIDGEQMAFNLIHLCAEFWFNQNPPTTVYSIPTVLSIECSKILLCHLFKCIPAFREAVIPSPTNLFRSARQQNLERFAWQQLTLLRRGVYVFVSQAFEYVYWAARTMRTLRKIVQLWLAFTAPWTLTPAEMTTDSVLKHALPNLVVATKGGTSSKTPPSPGSPQSVASRALSSVLARTPSFRRFGETGAPASPGKESTPTSSSAWIEQYQKSHMANHFALYSPLLVKFLNLARGFNFLQSEDLDSLSRVIDVWVELFSSPLRELEDEWERIVANAPNRSPAGRQLQESIHYTDPGVTNLRILDATPFATEVILLLRDLKPEFDRKKQSQNKSEMVQAVKFNNALASLCDMYAIPDKGEHLAANPRTQREIGKDDFFATPETRDARSVFLTDTGRMQITAGLRRCTNIDTPFFGDDRLRPVTSYEVAFLVKLCYQVSVLIKQQTGNDVDLRFLASHFSIFVACVAIGFIHFLMLVFPALWVLHPVYILFKILGLVLWILGRLLPSL